MPALRTLYRIKAILMFPGHLGPRNCVISSEKGPLWYAITYVLTTDADDILRIVTLQERASLLTQDQFLYSLLKKNHSCHTI